jgi:hypothetical protein
MRRRTPSELEKSMGWLAWFRSYLMTRPTAHHEDLEAHKAREEFLSGVFFVVVVSFAFIVRSGEPCS